MTGAEVSYERVGVFERQTLLNMLATAVNESARNQAANEAIIGRVREVEQELADSDRIREQLTEAHTSVQRDYEQCIRERDSLSEENGALAAEVNRQAESYLVLQAAHRQEYGESERLRQMVRDLGGNPNPPEDAKEEDDRVDDEGAASDRPGDPEPGPAGPVPER